MEENDKILIPGTNVYLIIPADYVCLYNKLLVMLSDFGLELIKDCQSSCKAKNKNIIDCWNMFQSACACYALSVGGNESYRKKADLYIKYIEAQIDNIYNEIDSEPFCKMIIHPITDDGRLTAEVGCGSDVHFHIKNKDYHLYEEYFNKDKTKEFHIDKNGHLIVNQECD
ncbi:hypothetical protein [Thomasclavelia cocleata]|uniref:hypothetical protein n=1 Tax=Thomasclavelia cocleata TaxID=69824 RepID=UPI002588070C|nr:hypothetical protein [Thomasclavelia cocleata]